MEAEDYFEEKKSNMRELWNIDDAQKKMISLLMEEYAALHKTNVICSFPDNVEIWEWWQTQKFQKEQGEQEYTMIYEIDLPKILKAFYDHFGNCI